ncbi:uncharacterized protein TNCV_4307291 [Trichonephila clavipes]|nr:uncharacterized protein TNCV_4307291 [Trichonephila clavipes]
MTEEKLIDHIISRLEPQILDYVEVRNPQTTSNLLQIIDKYEERFLNRKIRGIDRKIKGKREVTIDRRTIVDHEESSIDLRVKVLWIMRDSMVDAEVVNQIIDSTIKAVDKYGGDRSRGTENPPDTEHQTIRISSLRMTPVDLPYVPILLKETFITALWDSGAEKSFISEEVYRKYFLYRPRQKTKDRVVTAQGAPCCHLDRVELQIRIREF